MKVALLISLLVAAAVWASAGTAATLHGVVVARSHGTLLVATPSGAVRAVRGAASVGSRLAGAHVVGRADHARIHGVVVKRAGSTVFVASNRHLLAVHDATPAAPGAVVTTTVGIAPNGRLDDEDDDDVVGQVTGTLQVEATVTAVGTGTVTVSVEGRSLAVPLPNGLTLPASIVGQTVTFSVALDDRNGDDHGDRHRGRDGGGDH